MAMARPTRRNLGPPESFPPEASPNTTIGCAPVPLPRQCLSSELLAPVILQTPPPGGGGARVHGARVRPRSEKQAPA
eukprot:4731498-Pyramimonas_sp.AAC.1